MHRQAARPHGRALAPSSPAHPPAWPRTACSALERVQPRAVSYEEQVTVMREQLSELYEAQEEWSKAAHALAGIDLDSGGWGSNGILDDTPGRRPGRWLVSTWTV